MRLHVVSLVHTQTTAKYLHCAYTQKVVKFCKMMLAEGHEVFLYSGEENEAPCTEHIPLVSEQERAGWFGAWDENNLFGNVDWSPTHPSWLAMNQRAIAEIGNRSRRQDVLCLIAGLSQKPIADVLPNLMPAEWGVGYEGIALPCCAFESHAWRHHVYGLRGIRDGRSYDTVIPNFFDPEDFPAWEGERGDYLLFIGRLVLRKGPHVAAMIAERAGCKLLVAGPGATASWPGKIVAPEVVIEGKGVEYVGPVDAKQRWQLMSRAKAVVVPTLYLEPFGGVAAEAMMCGTSVIASDWGAFPEYVMPGISGERFSTLAEGAAAVEKVAWLDREVIRDFALKRFGLEAVGRQFTSWFHRLDTLWKDGWYS